VGEWWEAPRFTSPLGGEVGEQGEPGEGTAGAVLTLTRYGTTLVAAMSIIARHSTAVLAACFLTCVPASRGEDSGEGLRVWRAVSGQRVYGRYIGRDGEMIRLELKDGKRIEVNRMRLSERDRMYLVNAKRYAPTPVAQDTQHDVATATEPEDRSDEIQTRSFRVRLDALGLGGNDTDRELVRLLSEQGVEFKEGTNLRYNAGKKTLTIVHKGGELDKIERLLARMNVGTGKATYRMQVYKLSPYKVEKMKRFMEIQARWGKRVELKGEMETAKAEFKRLGKGSAHAKCEVTVPCGGRFRKNDAGGKGAAVFSGSSHIFPNGDKASLTLSAEINLPEATAPVAVTATAEPSKGETFIVMTHGEVGNSISGETRRQYFICEITLVDIGK